MSNEEAQEWWVLLNDKRNNGGWMSMVELALLAAIARLKEEADAKIT